MRIQTRLLMWWCVAMEKNDNHQGTLVTLQSLLTHFKPSSSNIRLNLFLLTKIGEYNNLNNLVQCYFSGDYMIKKQAEITVLEFDPIMINAPIKVKDKRERDRLISPVNYARFYFNDIFDNKVEYVIQIDNDVLVLDNIEKLYNDSVLKMKNYR
eukprot:UN34779